MRAPATATVAVIGIIINHALAVEWTKANAFPCPVNVNNECSPAQVAGYDWKDVSAIDFDSYGDHRFSGFQYFNAPRNRMLFGGNASTGPFIAGKLNDRPSMSSGGSHPFSISRMRIATSAETDVECVYDMLDGSKCKETYTCAPGGSQIYNTQCGGARSVTFSPGRNAPDAVYVRIHSIDFHCDTMSAMKPTVKVMIAKKTLHTISKPVICPGSTCMHHSLATKTDTAQSTSMRPLSCREGPCTATKTINAYPARLSDYPDPPTPLKASESVFSSVIDESTADLSRTPKYPALLPRCLNTWLFITTCTDSTDESCFCTDQDFVQKAMGCMSAWSTNEVEAQEAASLLVGLCAQYIAVNPAIVTSYPSTYQRELPLSPSSPARFADKTLKTNESYTTITFSSALEIPATWSTGVSAGLPIAGSSYTTKILTTMTVPQLRLATSTVTMTGLTKGPENSRMGPEKWSHTYSGPLTSYIAGPMGTRPHGYANLTGTAWSGATWSSTLPIVPATGGSIRTQSSLASLALGFLIVYVILI